MNASTSKLVLALALASASGLLAQPGVEEFKDALTRQLLKLRPDWSKERNVLFVSAQAVGGGAFRATVVIRDYDAGYPPNRYYGRTCAAKMDNAQFTSFRDQSGELIMQGRLTPLMEENVCKPNPAANTTSIPLNALPGTPARSGGTSVAGRSPSEDTSWIRNTGPAAANPAGSAPTYQQRQQAAPAPPPTPAATSGGAGIPAGAYECWSYNQPRALFNFTIRNGGQYTFNDGSNGTYSYNPGTQRVTFTGGSLPGVLGQDYYPIYHAPGGRPTVSLRSARSGAEVTFCQRN